MPDDILYHYCSTEAFCSIIENRSIRLSAITLSNDSMEGRWIQRIFRDSAMDISGGSDNLAGRQRYVAETSESMWAGMYGLGFCLSEARDMLSQWRGYANNAAGVCIGFSSTYLERLAKASTINGLSHLLVHVEYDRAVQIPMLKPLLDILQEIYMEGDGDIKNGHLIITYSRIGLLISNTKI